MPQLIDENCGGRQRMSFLPTAAARDRASDGRFNAI
jgi:hypothetical protein